MRNPGGYGIWFNGQGRDIERDSFTCCHCCRVVFVPPKADPTACGGFCRQCMKHTCPACADEQDRTMKCVPLEKRIEEMERQGERRRHYDAALARG